LKYPPLLSILAAGLACCAANAQISRLGAMGDSLSDEYAEESYSYAKNWTMQFVLYRGVNMGPTAAAAQQPGGTWGEPRRTYYQSNWARYGDTTDDLLADGQHTGLAAQVAPLGISHAVLMIGANDFNSVGLGAYFNIYNGFWSTSQINTYVAGRIANVRTVLDAVAPTGTRLVLVNVFDFGITPITWGSAFYNDPIKRDRVTAAIQQVNAGLLSLAQEYHIVLVDAFGLAQTAWGTNQNPRTTLLLGNVTIQLRQYDTSTNTNPTAAFVHDRAHPHTTMQGVLANILVEALNQGYGAGLTPFTEEEILSHAGLAYGGQNTLSAVLGPLSSYVHNFVCYANCDGSTAAPVLNVNDFSCFLNRYAAGDARANCDNSTVAPVLNVNDFSCFLNRYAVGCP
jgi:lysophospholipase L1-like esterase